MPRKNSLKEYVEDGIYHVYNRGVEKRIIFEDEKDYRVFLSYVKSYLVPRDPDEFLGYPDLSASIELLAYCLMPNHFHLLVKQQDLDGMARLMRGVSTRYAMYFNKRNDRVGALFQGPYKAVRITTNEQLIHLSRYIHRNPAHIAASIDRYPYSSYQYYFSHAPVWLHPHSVLELFSSTAEYKSFIHLDDVESEFLLQGILLE